MAKTKTPTTAQASTFAESPSAAVVLTLTGGSNAGSRAEAESLGKFITHIAEANRAISKAVAENRYEDSRDASGRPTKRKVRTQPLQIEPLTGVEEGITITFRAPEIRQEGQTEDVIEAHLPIEGFIEDTIESAALRTVFRSFTIASSDDNFDDEELVLSLETAPARDAVRKAVNLITHAGWSVSGQIIQLNREPETITLTKRGQARLLDALKADLIGKYRWQVKGSIDGHKNSNNTVFFRAVNTAQSWSTVAATDHIFADAARISLDPRNEVELTIEFEPKTDRDGNPTERVNKTIVSIDRVYRAETTQKLF